MEHGVGARDLGTVQEMVDHGCGVGEHAVPPWMTLAHKGRRRGCSWLPWPRGGAAALGCWRLCVGDEKIIRLGI